MPIARLQKLASDKRQRLFEVAAREFATYGFEQASLNRILADANIGKSSAYYFFENKADLFAAVVQYALERLKVADLGADVEQLTAETFWPTLATLRREPLMRSFEHPWFFWVLSVTGQDSPVLLERELRPPEAEHVTGLVRRLVQRGQQLHVVRTDLPNELLCAWLFGLDKASDRWMMAHWEELDRASVAALSDQTVAAIRNALAPPNAQ
ncbi:MAG: TetR/AcrR family transcriptional regulator [Chloroflexi bacterium]|nr:TetR/AcrR family transcriptional regulator [Chloroflexota bacterium]